MPREPPKRPGRRGRGFFPEENPMAARRRVAEKFAKAMALAKEKEFQEVLKKNRQRNCFKGGFLDVHPRTEKGIFLRLFKRGKKGEMQRVIVQPEVQKFKFLQDYADNLKRELSYYKRLLNYETSEITLYGQRNLVSFVDKDQKLGVVKIIVEAFPYWRFTEATTLFFDKKGNLVIEHIKNPWKEGEK